MWRAWMIGLAVGGVFLAIALASSGEAPSRPAAREQPPARGAVRQPDPIVVVAPSERPEVRRVRVRHHHRRSPRAGRPFDLAALRARTRMFRSTKDMVGFVQDAPVPVNGLGMAEPCVSWFGGGVVAMYCNAARLRITPAGFRAAPEPVAFGGPNIRSSGSTHGLTQAIGAPLIRGDRITIKAGAISGGELDIKAYSGRHAIHAHFANIGEVLRGRSYVELFGAGRGALVVLTTFDSRRFGPDTELNVAIPRRYFP
jgi:hypothetical protein